MVIHSAPRAVALAASALLALVGVAACASDATDADPSRLNVVAAFYPLQYVAERVGGDAVRVTNLTKPGAEPHDLELNPGQVGQVVDAKLIIYLKGFQPAVDAAIDQNGSDHAFDVAAVQPLLDGTDDGHDHEGGAGAGQTAGRDPHIWLDPTRLATVGDRFAEQLGTLDPDRAADYTERAQALRADLETLDTEYAEGLRICQRRTLVTSHASFGYLANRYQLEQVSVSGLTPENEPSPRRLGEVAAEAKEHGATTIFFETLVSPKVAETIARTVGAKTAVLDPIEGLQPGDTRDYLSVMRANLTTLKNGLSCS